MFYRAVPGDEPTDLNQLYFDKVNKVKAAMQVIQPEADIILNRRFAVPPLKPEKNGEAEGLVRTVTGDNANHVVSYGTEAGQFQDAGYSAVVCGPGDIAQAHQPNEFIEVAQFEAGHKFMGDLLAGLT
jgi:acetylornithine deacetylase